MEPKVSLSVTQMHVFISTLGQNHSFLKPPVGLGLWGPSGKGFQLSTPHVTWTVTGAI